MRVRAGWSGRLLSGAIVAVTAAITVGVASTPASAVTALTTMTTLSTTITADGNLSLTASVSINRAPIGLYAIPNGNVTFSDDAGDALGAVALPNCRTKACTVTTAVNISQLSASVTSLTASYAGNFVLGPSSAANTILFNRCSVSTGCVNYLKDTTTYLGVSLPMNDAVLATLGGPALPCSAGAGDVVNLATSGTGKVIAVSVGHLGAPVSTYLARDAATTVAKTHTGYLCAVRAAATYPGFSSGTGTYNGTAADFAQYGAVPQLTAGAYASSFAGLVADCSYALVNSPGKVVMCQNGVTPAAGSDQIVVAMLPATGLIHLAG